MKKLVLAVSLILLCLYSFSSHAATVQLAYTGVDPGEAVNVKLGNFYTGWVLAGNYLVDLKDSQNKLLGSFRSFCVDMAWAPEKNKYFTYELKEIIENRHKAAAYVLYQQNLGNQTYSNKVANQIAVWEIVFDWGNINLDNGNFVLKSTSWKSQTNSVIEDALNNYSKLGSYNMFLLAVHPAGGDSSGKNYQDFLIPNPNPSPPVPLPPSVLLLLSGLLGIFGIRRKMAR
ncbi:MAG: hypothetical protein N2513_10275 [Deltaproteobacteria bacterium]|nr:hypothetical protein [Deltaproteobacteria bacterium]